jgi:hypothetical protein
MDRTPNWNCIPLATFLPQQLATHIPAYLCTISIQEPSNDKDSIQSVASDVLADAIDELFAEVQQELN